jgi:hypothetical protein
MTLRFGGLARRIFDPRLSIPFRVDGLSRDITGDVATLEVTSTDRGQMVTPQVSMNVQLDRFARATIYERPGALWSVQARMEDGQGSASPFAPPTELTLDETLPIRVHDTLVERLRDLRLPLGSDMVQSGALRLGSGRVAVLGMRTVGALDEHDAARLTWWLPDHGALELLMVEEAGRAWLQLIDVVPEGDAATAHAGPNVRLNLGPSAVLELSAAAEGRTAPASALSALRLDASPVLEAWIRYGAAQRRVSVDRQQAREQCDLRFQEAHQRAAAWAVHIELDEAARKAWLGAEAEEGRDVRVDQTVGLRVGDDLEKGWTIDTMTLRGVSAVTAVLKPPRSGGRLPPTGVLAACENVGSRIGEQRERDALDRLTAGRAACRQLPVLLREPHRSSHPGAVKLRPSRVTLDKHQRRAVELIVGCVDLVAIQGPPGTGKTRVIVEALQQILAGDRCAGRPVRVLVSSVQNEAVANVVERLNQVDGMLVRLVQREGADDDEALAFARSREGQRCAVIERLSEALADYDHGEQLREIEELMRRLDAVRTHGLGRRVDATTSSLVALAEDSSPRLSTVLREEARELAASILAIEDADLAEAHQEPTPGVISLPPGDPAAVSTWWEEVVAAIPPTDRAALEVEVRSLVRALDRPPSPRRERRVALALAALGDLFRGLGVDRVEDTQVRDSLEPQERWGRLDAWCVQARRELLSQERDLLCNPRAIAQRFLDELRADTGSWSRILDQHAEAVAATCSKSATAELPAGEAYDWVIIDEAGRASPFELLVPMVQGERVVLIGDHRQLPPMVDDALVASANAGEKLDIATTTLFGELFSRLPPPCCVRLAIQYRMHGEIGSLVDQVFYRPEGEGLTSFFSGPRAVERRASFGVYDDLPLVWVDVSPPPRSCTERNDAEVDAILAVLRRYQTAGVPEGQIAVISPYRKQEAAIRARLDRHPELARIAQVRRIDQVQGREYPVVIITLVRTDGSPGFLASPNRINVAISRAQRQLVILGAAQPFLRSRRVARHAPHLVKIIRHMKAFEREA